MLKKCARCGQEFTGAANSNFCAVCKKENDRERSRRYYYTSGKYLQHQHEQRCVVCGKNFASKTCAKYCPDCREAAYKQKDKESARRRCRSVPCIIKPKFSPQESRLARLRARLAEAQTPAERSKYFREYVLCKQELLRRQPAKGAAQ